MIPSPPASAVPRIALTGGGTAGHVFPLLAVASAYQAARPDTACVFIGAEGDPTAQLAAAAGLAVRTVPAAPLFGVGPRGKLRALSRLLRGRREARRLLAAEAIQLVIGSGGYVSAAPLLAAHRLGLVTALIEPNAAPGLTNRLLGRLVDRVYLGTADALPQFSARRALVTGVPLRAGLTRTRATGDGGARVLVTGGTQGSPFLNAEAPELLAAVRRALPSLRIWHQAGELHAAAVAAAYRRADLPARVDGFIADIGEAYTWADVVVSAGGAITLAELAAVGVPALVVPRASVARDHQADNARAFAEHVGVWASERHWDRQAQAAWLTARLREAVARPTTPSPPPAAAAIIVEDCDRLLAAARAHGRRPLSTNGESRPR
ncbi:MAG: glycosyltransferase [Candidatus Binatia bacterium]